jgi:hypothetical protein
MRFFASANMSYFDAQLRSDLNYGDDKVKTCDDFMSYGLDFGPFTRSSIVKGKFEYPVYRSHSRGIGELILHFV